MMRPSLSLSLSFLSSYRSAAEVKEVRDTRDPLKKCEQLALELNLMTSDEIKVYTILYTECYNRVCILYN